MKITIIGIDTAKHVFELHGADERGRTVLSKQLRRGQLMKLLAQLAPCRVGLEACAGSHHLGRQLKRLGHEPKLMNPYEVKAYVRGDKTDAHDAEGVCEATSRERVRSIPVKSVEQQAMLSVHRVREQWVKTRTALSNQLRGLMYEFGVVVGQGRARLMSALPEVLEDGDNELPDSVRELLARQGEWLREVDKEVKRHDRELGRQARAHPVCRRLLSVPGIGPLTATALVALVGDGRQFNNGRQLAAWLGVVARKHGTGGKVRLLGMSKRGNGYARKLLVHGGRSVVTASASRHDAHHRWAQAVAVRRGRNIAAVAVANKNARIAWALMVHGGEYDSARASA